MNPTKIIPIVHKTDTTTGNDSLPVLDEKHTVALKFLIDNANNVSNTQYTNVNLDTTYQITKKTKITFVIMPKWATYIPPYNVARLVAVCKEAGYETTAFDFNVEGYWLFQNNDENLLYGKFGEQDFKWVGNQYSENVEEKLNPVIDQWLEQIIETKPSVVGFSLYYTNVFPTLRMAKLLKERLPDVKIIVGGSQIHSKWDSGIYENVDHIVDGEAEEIILEVLDKIENKIDIGVYKIESDKTRKVSIDQLPFPDYSHFDLSKYQLPNTISTEISRGCVAKCTFCDETHFWKFRSRTSNGIIDEIEFQHKNYNIYTFWFLDSLVNGNIKELHNFALEVIDRKLPIQWQGYARADKRMDLQYLQDLKDSGCMSLNYGVESGSQPVLDSMKKNITPEIIENNIKDGYKAGIVNFTQWMLGYPNERINDIAKTFNLIWRIHWYQVNWISRTSCQLGGNTRLLQDLEKYNIAIAYTRDDKPTFKRFLNAWFTNDYENTKLHRLVRYKSINILCLELPYYKHIDSSKVQNFASQYYAKYEVELDENSNIEEFQDLPYEDFDYFIIKDPQLKTNFHLTLVNEIFALIRILWRAHKCQGMIFNVKFDPIWDMNEYGSDLADNFTADYKFEINNLREWKISAMIKLHLQENPYTPWSLQPSDYNDFNIDLNWTGTGTW